MVSDLSNYEEINKKEKNHEISGLERCWLIVRKSGAKISVLMNGQILEGEVVCHKHSAVTALIKNRA